MKRLLNLLVQRVLWHRRLVGAALAGISVLLLGSALSAPAGPTETAVAARQALPAGHVLTTADLHTVELPPDAIADGVFTAAEELVGRSTAVAIGAGTTLQPGLLAVSHSTEPGRSLVPITLSDDNLRSLLSPGDRISLIAAGYEEVQVLTDDARVAVLASPPSGGSSPLAAVNAGSGSMILVDVATAEAPLVAALGQDGGLRIVLGGAPVVGNP